ncbi:spore germination protein [Paenibacillus donghaensis]|nr:spore germination protein [Paenibacillus donghaensis]
MMPTARTESDPLKSKNLADNLAKLTDSLGHSPDIIVRKFTPLSIQAEIAAVFMEGLVEQELVEDFLKDMMVFERFPDTQPSSVEAMFDLMKHKTRGVGEKNCLKEWNHLFEALLSGSTVILVDGISEALSSNTSGGEVRTVTEATTQVSIRGPKESFTESLGTNLSLVRRKIKSPNLWVESMKIGDVTQTEVSIMYMHGIVNEDILAELRKKLQAIHVDAILESGYIEQLIEENVYSPLPTLFNTERPDSVAGNLLEGRIAIFVDGTPFVLIAPTTFFMFFHAVEDYYQRFDISTLIRILRLICLMISLFGPAVFVATLTFHQEMIPTSLLINLASQREGVPFPTFIEAVIMELTFEIIREAGIRMPSPIGQTVSIIGGLVLGQAAVQAGIVSPAMVIVVSLTGISSFTTPAFNMALSVRVLRFIIMFIAAFMGLYGITIFMFILIAHMCSLRSLGFPFMSPFGPFIAENQKDTLLRVPLNRMRKRPRLVSQKNKIRLETEGDSRGDRQ